MILPPALAPSEDVAVLVQAAALGALIGTTVAARRRSRDPEFDAWLITARWTVGFSLVTLVILVVDGLR